MGTCGRLLERDDHRADDFVGQARKPVLGAHAAVLSLFDIAPYGLRFADEIETSMVLVIAPDTVDMSKAVKDYDAQGKGGRGRAPPPSLWL